MREPGPMSCAKRQECRGASRAVDFCSHAIADGIGSAAACESIDEQKAVNWCARRRRTDAAGTVDSKTSSTDPRRSGQRGIGGFVRVSLSDRSGGASASCADATSLSPENRVHSELSVTGGVGHTLTLPRRRGESNVDNTLIPVILCSVCALGCGGQGLCSGVAPCSAFSASSTD